MDQNVKKEIISRLISIATTLTFLIVVTWFWFGPRVKMTEAKANMAASIVQVSNLEFVDLSEGIHLENAYPISDTIGKSMEPYRFQVTNHDQKDATFTIAFVNDLLEIEKDNCKILANNYLRYTIKKNEQEETPVRNLALDGSMYQDTLKSGETATYELRFWIDQNAGNEIMDTHFHAKVSLIQEMKSET